MSIRSLLATTVSATESGIQGIVGLGSVLGDGSTWLKRQSQRINHAEVVKTEEREFLIGLQERNQAVIKKAETLDADYVSKLEALDQLLGIK